MDIAALSMNLAQTNLLNDVGTAVLSKSLEQAQGIHGRGRTGRSTDAGCFCHGAFCIS